MVMIFYRWVVYITAQTTGYNVKTTTNHLLSSVLSSFNKDLINTISNYIHKYKLISKNIYTNKFKYLRIV